ncbi:50S ribosomal protein L3 [secondary endosymbiont of Trabutina mannipara]|uniref:Large ribosomal subunit protein uL3 n=1 Tax=secondary endosymbiont of Trabutina mannipara TaxID=1835721 RepID=A0A1C3L4C0_9ENTR|nr:50S ribosomal protein L3 [secondary endosymbiont of Trabutina mannipara]SBT82111.1 50S ribosomal protein L3 [secondary endosymbiont of Trabutina mannipara]
MKGLIGRKVGMTRLFTEGISIPITVIEIKENSVIQIKNFKNDGYNAIQITSGIKNKKRINKSEAGHFAKSGVEVGCGLWEFKINNIEEMTVGQNISVEIFSTIKKVDITGISKGKGFAGTVKRWNFHTQDSTHGNSLSHRAPGSIGQNQTPGKVFKGKKMSGQLGNKKVTIQNLDIIRIDIQRNLLLVKGAVPGAISNHLIIKPAIKA